MTTPSFSPCPLCWQTQLAMALGAERALEVIDEVLAAERLRRAWEDADWLWGHVADCCGDDKAVAGIYQHVKRSIVAKLPHDGWTLTEKQIAEAVLKGQDDEPQ